MTQSERDPEKVARSLARLAHRLTPTDDAARDRQGRARLLERADAAEGARGAASRAWLWALAVPATAAAVAFGLWWNKPKALAYEVIGARAEGAYVSAPSDRTVALQFSDETHVDVEPGSQLRVESTDPRGARILLERGRTDVHVIHREGARWSFAAGPFEVLVTGTRFDLNWDPAAQMLDLHLREGSVEIATPFGAAPVSLRSGQDFHADMRARSITTTEHASAASVAPSSASAVAPGPAPMASDGTASAPSAAPPSMAASGVPSGEIAAPSIASTRPWSKLVAAGNFAEVLREADQRGADACLKACNAADLGALADAARYSGKNTLASQSLLALRARFAQSQSGRSAAFLLGRLSEQQGNASDARTWYVRYLNEAAGGMYAAEALAGKMRTTLSLEGTAAAAPIAAEYLQKYPNGAYTGAARSITGRP